MRDHVGPYSQRICISTEHLISIGYEFIVTCNNPACSVSMFSTPIINQPLFAILVVGIIENRAVFRHDAIAIRPMVYLSLTFDHRIIDGAVADQFMSRIKAVVENWDE